MLGSVFVSLGLVIVAPPSQLTAAVSPALSMLHSKPIAASSNLLDTQSTVVFPTSQSLGAPVNFVTTSVLSEATLEGEKMFGDADLDGIAVAVIPFALFGILFVLFRVAKMFISAF